MSLMWSAWLHKALMAALSRYSTALRSTVSMPPLPAASRCGGAERLVERVDVAQIDLPRRDQHECAVVATRGVEGEQRGHQVILADR